MPQMTGFLGKKSAGFGLRVLISAELSRTRMRVPIYCACSEGGIQASD